jgi:hypothetical protein
MPRKTIAVEEIREMVNRWLATPNAILYLRATGGETDLTPAQAFRLGLCSLLEQVLMQTGNYHGFGYQEGVVDFSADPPAFGDETRRIYG